MDMYTNRYLLYNLAKSDFRQKYLGSYLGIMWAFVSPLITVLIFIFVFQVGFKVPPISKVPFAVWLCTGIIPWFYFSEALAEASLSIRNYSFLVKKVVFRVSLLPLVKIFSAFIIHVFLLGILLALLLFGYAMYPSLYWIQYFYYLLCLITLLISLSWITASLSVFTKDVSNMITVLLQFGFWMTPIFWRIEQIPEKYWIILQANPIYYIIQGFRDTFLYSTWFWDRPIYSMYFWTFVAVLLCLGRVVFKKTRPHFADVL